MAQQSPRWALAVSGGGLCNIRTHPLTRRLYVRNCNRKVAGNLSSIYQTLISLFNLSQDRFYYKNPIANVFLEKMMRTIGAKVSARRRAVTHMLPVSQGQSGAVSW